MAAKGTTVVKAKSAQTLQLEFETWMEGARKLVAQLPYEDAALRQACTGLRERAFDIHFHLRAIHDRLAALEETAKTAARERVAR